MYVNQRSRFNRLHARIHRPRSQTFIPVNRSNAYDPFLCKFTRLVTMVSAKTLATPPPGVIQSTVATVSFHFESVLQQGNDP
jgi:hypothetical protein